MIKASVCIPTYNHEAYITQAIEGALMQQTDFPFEIIIGEDDSTDNTRKITVEFAQRYPEKIRLLLNDRKNVIYINGRPTGRWNFVNTIKQAQGQYIALCEGDDYWTDPRKLHNQVAFLEENPEYAGTFHETQVMVENGSSERIFGQDVPDVLTVADTIAVATPFHTSAFLFRNDTWIFPDWYNRVASGDIPLFSMVAGKGPLKKIPGVMSVYRKHPGGMTNSPEYQRSFYAQRIELINYLNEYHEFRYDFKAQAVIQELLSRKQRVQRQSDFFYRLRRTLKIRTRIRQLLNFA